MIKGYKAFICAVTLVLSSINVANAGLISSSFNMQIVVDNDFAVFGGTSSSISELLYQNPVSWYTQVANIQNFSFNLQQGNDFIYVLALDGGGIASFAGTLNGVNVTDPSLNVSLSSNLSSYLTGYNLGAAAAGTYNALLQDVQASFAGLTWTTPTISNSPSQVIQASLNQFGSGYLYNINGAQLFRFSAPELNISVTPASVPEPATLVIFGFALLAMRRFSKR